MVISSIMIDYLAPCSRYTPEAGCWRQSAQACWPGWLCHYLYAEFLHRRHRLYHNGGKALKPYLSLGKIAFCRGRGIILIGGILFRDMDGIVYGMIINFLFAVVVDKAVYGINAGRWP